MQACMTRSADFSISRVKLGSANKALVSLSHMAMLFLKLWTAIWQLCKGEKRKRRGEAAFRNTKPT